MFVAIQSKQHKNDDDDADDDDDPHDHDMIYNAFIMVNIV